MPPPIYHAARQLPGEIITVYSCTPLSVRSSTRPLSSDAPVENQQALNSQFDDGPLRSRED